MRALRSSLILFVATVLLAPVGAVALLAFSRSTALDFFQNFEPELRWWRAALEDSTWRSALATSATVAAASTVLAFAVALPAVVAIRLHSSRWADVALLATALPLALPPVVLAVGMNRLLSGAGSLDTLHGAAFAHLPLTLAVVTLTLRAAARASPPDLYWAARALGSGPLAAGATWVKSTLRSGVVAAACAAFLTSVAEVTVCLFVTDLRVLGFSRRALSGSARDLEPTGFAVFTLWFITTLAVGFALQRRRPRHAG